MKSLLIWFFQGLNQKIQTPGQYGSYHFAWVFATVAIALSLIFFFSRTSEIGARAIIALFWITLLIMEILKQLFCSIIISGDNVSFIYNFSIFPYQFCATPLYVLPMAAFMRRGHKRDTAIVFLSTFAIIGGIAILVAPSSVFTDNAFINFQSMLHHSAQIFLGLYLAFRYRRLLTYRNFSRAAIAFLFMCYLAVMLNIMFYKIFSILNIDQSFNMFFLSPYDRYIPPILVGVGLEKAPYILILLGYIFLLTLAAFLLMRVEIFFIRKTNHEKNKDLVYN